MFAKLFQLADYGQVLVKRDSNDEGRPEVRTYFHPDNYGICSFAISFDDTESGAEAADRVFAGIDEEKTMLMVVAYMRESPVQFTFSQHHEN